MNERYLGQRIRDILQQRIAMGGGEGGVDARWPDFVKLVQDVTAEEGGSMLPYSDAMSLASPIWASLKADGTINGQGQARRRRAGGLSGGNEELLEEMIGAGFTRDEIVGLASALVPLLASAAQHVIPLFASDKAKKTARRQAKESAREAKEDRDRDRGRLPRPKPKPAKVKPESVGEGRGGRSPARPKSRSRSRSKTPSRSSSKSRSRSRSKTPSRPRSRGSGGAAKRSRGKTSGLEQYHAGLARFKSQHPRMSHRQAQTAYSKVYKKKA